MQLIHSCNKLTFFFFFFQSPNSSTTLTLPNKQTVKAISKDLGISATSVDAVGNFPYLTDGHKSLMAKALKADPSLYTKYCNVKTPMVSREEKRREKRISYQSKILIVIVTRYFISSCFINYLILSVLSICIRVSLSMLLSRLVAMLLTWVSESLPVRLVLMSHTKTSWTLFLMDGTDTSPLIPTRKF